MILRALAFAAGVTGAAGLSQFPEFSQQYQQRLGGAVDELAQALHQFDTDASLVGLSRDAALAELAGGGAFAAARAESMTGLVARHARLQADLAALEGADPFTRVTRLTHMRDRDIAARTLQAYKPAIPVTPEGAVFAGAGFLFGWGGAALVGTLFGLFWRRRRAAA